jgi:carbonic anhydrase
LKRSGTFTEKPVRRILAAGLLAACGWSGAWAAESAGSPAKPEPPKAAAKQEPAKAQAVKADPAKARAEPEATPKTAVRPARLPLHSKEKAAPQDADEQAALERIAVKIAERLAASHGAKEATVEPQAKGVKAMVVIKTPAAPPKPKPKPVAKKAPAVTPPPPPPPIKPEDWAYAGAGGPESWGNLHPDFAACRNGQRQSPIDIRDGLPVDQDPVQFDYRLSGLSVIDTGRTIQANLTRGNIIFALGRQYELQYVHFHLPAEERINGRGFDMVAHLVHKDKEGRIAIVAVLMERGAAHEAMQMVWNNLPLQRKDEVRSATPLDPSAFLPLDRRYYAYIGSLTSPPCTEGVLWLVMKQPVTVSPEQMAVFARLYPMNARPIQSAAGRLIRESR